MSNPSDDKLMSKISCYIGEVLEQLDLTPANDEDTSPGLSPSRQISGSSHTAKHMTARPFSTLNEGELKSVYALLAYVAHNENIQQETVEALVEASFHVNHLSRLQQKDYDEVIRFLVDLRLDELQH